jgi:hypothetical protein
MIAQSSFRILLLQTCSCFRLGLQNPSLNVSKAAIYRTKAILALHSNSCVSVRLARYNSHMVVARGFEAIGTPNEDLKSAAGRPIPTSKGTG